jgi:signal transduction histidine kinase
MAATRRCNMCGTDFNGRTDAVYCSSACRQKAHRARMADHLAKLARTLPVPSSVGEHAPLPLAGARQQLLTRGAGPSHVFDDVADDLARALHDSARQRLVTLALQLRQAEASIPDELTDTRAQLCDVVSGLADVAADLQEIACGIHPAIVSGGGLSPVLKTLAQYFF